MRPKWKTLFATALYTGMRKGELFALQKSDVDFTSGLILVSRSHERDIPKGGRVEAVPINSELLVYLKRAMCRAGLLTGYVHKCRHDGIGHRAADPDRGG